LFIISINCDWGQTFGQIKNGCQQLSVGKTCTAIFAYDSTHNRRTGYLYGKREYLKRNISNNRVFYCRLLQRILFRLILKVKFLKKNNFYSFIIPAPTVSLLPSSMKIILPVMLFSLKLS